MSDTKSTGSWSRNGAQGAAEGSGLAGSLSPGLALSANLTLVDPLAGSLWRGQWQPSRNSANRNSANPSSASQQVAVRFGEAQQPAAAQAEVQHFLQQAQVCRELNDPRFVSILECGHSPSGQAYQAIEWIDNSSLRDQLHASGSLPLEQAVAVAWQTTEAITKLHKAGRAHGRLRTEHIFPATESSPRLKLSAPGIWASTVANVQRLRAYESPARLLQGQPHTASDDLWMLAVSLYEAVTTILPFEAGTEAAVTVAICNGEFAPPSRFRAELPMTVDLWFARALSRNQAQRFDTAEELYASFSRACNPAGGTAGLSRLDEETDDEKTAQWSLPDEWTADSSRAPGAPAHVGPRPAIAPMSRPNPVSLRATAAPQLPSAVVPRRPVPQPQAPLAPVAAVALPSAPAKASASNTPARSNPLSLVAGGLGLALLLFLAVWQFFPASRADSTQMANAAEAPQAAPPPHEARALQAAISDVPLRTINAAEFLAGNDVDRNADGDESNSKAEPPAKSTSSAAASKAKKSKKRARAQSQLKNLTSKASRKNSTRSSKLKKRSKKRKTKRSKRRRTSTSSKRKKNCVLIDSQGIRRINPSCL